MANLFTSVYEMIEKVTKASAAEFNIRWQSIDNRLNVLEVKHVIANVLIPGATSAGKKGAFVMPFNGRNFTVALATITGPTTDDMFVDINKNGVTIFTTQANRPTIEDGDTEGPYSAVADIATIDEGDRVEIEVDAAPGAPTDLMVTIRGEKLA